MLPSIKNKPTILHFLSKWALPLLLVATILIIKCFPFFIEKYYSTGIYKSISGFLRMITGWFPFSIGDVFYFLVGLSVIKWLAKGITLLIKRKVSWEAIGLGGLKIVRKILWLFIWFHVLWGLNYSREGIGYQLQLTTQESYTQQELDDLTCDLIEKVNELRKSITADSTLPQPTTQALYTNAKAGYQLVAKQHHFLEYQFPSLKKPLLNSMGDYFGFTGYYNPFSGEAQTRTDLPKVMQPYIICHEMAHQLGYASESEANFVGYLTCSASNDTFFKYSVYLDLYKYAASELFMKDFKTSHRNDLDKWVRKDLRDIRLFFNKRSNYISPMMASMYNQYLKANDQTKGIESYNEVVGLLIAYKKKYGKI
jgi:Protein of unknown function (DUF3810)